MNLIKRKLGGAFSYFNSFYKDIIKRFKMNSLSRRWREINAHNMTLITNPVNQVLFPIDKVKVGKNTYGGLHVVPYNNTDGNLFIGSYCSIAKDVKFLLGGNHDYKRFSTYPFKILFDWKGSSFSKGDIVICDDVWIGEGALFLSGVTVGQGAVVAANSVVTHDVQPYEIVAGNPMRHIKYRFSEKVIKHLMRIDFDKLDLNSIQNKEIVFSQRLSDDNIESFMANVPENCLRPAQN